MQWILRAQEKEEEEPLNFRFSASGIDHPDFESRYTLALTAWKYP
jgi:hypothetical protein